VLTRSFPEAAAAVALAIRQSLDHLRPWMPWATDEQATVAAQTERLRQAVASWDAGTDYIFELRHPEGDGAVLGAIGLHRRLGAGAIEIGYWTHVDYSGRGYMSAAAKAVTSVAQALPDVERVEIHTDEANVRSAAIPRKLGYRLDRVDERIPQAPAESGRLQIWILP
jgi:RimJ/RimL family protein N-acetyltransferase